MPGPSRRPRLDLDAPEPTVRNALLVLRLQSRLIRLESERVRRRTDQLRAQSLVVIARSRVLCRRSGWLLRNRRPLPRLVPTSPEKGRAT